MAFDTAVDRLYGHIRQRQVNDVQEIAKVVFAESKSVVYMRETPITFAIRCYFFPEHSDDIREFCQRQPYNPNGEPSLGVLDEDASAIIRILVKAGADINQKFGFYGYQPIHLAAVSGCIPLIDLVMGLGGIWTPEVPGSRTSLMHVAIRANQIEAALFIHDRTGSIHGSFDEHILNVAIQCDMAHICINLLKRNKFALTKEHLGILLINAADDNQHDLVYHLLSMGADPCFCGPAGDTALHASYHPDVMRALLAAGANPLAEDIMGFTPLHVNIKDCRAAAVRLLLTWGQTYVASQNDIENISPLQLLVDFDPSSESSFIATDLLTYNPLAPLSYISLLEDDDDDGDESEHLAIFRILEAIYYKIFSFPCEEEPRPVVELACEVGRCHLVAVLLLRGHRAPADIFRFIATEELLLPSIEEDSYDDEEDEPGEEDEERRDMQIRANLNHVVRLFSLPWSMQTHGLLFPPKFSALIATIFLVKTVLARRDENKPARPLAHLPFEMWLAIAGFVPREFFPPTNEPLNTFYLDKVIQFSCLACQNTTPALC
jgi:hypothetical protein